MVLLFASAMFLTCLLLYELYSVNRNLIHMDLRKQEREFQYDNEIIKFFILLPVLNEKDKIDGTLNHFQKMNYSKKELIFVTTEKELLTTRYEESVCKLVKEIAKNYHNVKCIQCPFLQGNKATQLNYAINILASEQYTKDNFIVVYDIDSRPDMNTFQEINQKYRFNDEIKVFQQSSLFIANFSDLNYWFKSEALMQTRRSLGIEVPNYRFTERYRGNSYLIPYCVGHGLAVQLQFIIENKGFPEPYEDIAFGVKMILQKEYICPLEICFDKAEVVTNFKRYMKQLGIWYQASCTGMIEILRNGCEIRDKIKPLLQSGLDILSWDYYILFFLIILFGGVFLRFIGLSCIVMLSVINAMITLKYVGKMLQNYNIIISIKESIVFVLCYLPRELVRGIAPVSALVQLLWKKILVKDKKQ